jgi:hypothetical protein
MKEHEEVDAWDEVSVGEDDRTLTFSGLHPTPWARSPGSWWVFSRAITRFHDDAVSVCIRKLRRPAGTPGAALEGDPEHSVQVVLSEPLRGRAVVDGRATLSRPEPSEGVRAERQRWERVCVQGDWLVVYWHGLAVYPLDHVSLEWTDDELRVAVWNAGRPGKLAGRYRVAVVPLDRPLGDRKIRRGT